MRYYLINLIMIFLPHSRFFGFKNLLLKFAGCTLGKHVRIQHIRILGSKLTVGDDSFIGCETMICGAINSRLIIGSNCDISNRVNFVMGTHCIGDANRRAAKGYGLDIHIGNGCWVGFGATILPGVKIGNGVIIAAGSLVNCDIPDNVMVAGIPAKIKKRLSLDGL